MPLLPTPSQLQQTHQGAARIRPQRSARAFHDRQTPQSRNLKNEKIRRLNAIRWEREVAHWHSNVSRRKSSELHALVCVRAYLCCLLARVRVRARACVCYSKCAIVCMLFKCLPEAPLITCGCEVNPTNNEAQVRQTQLISRKQ